MPRHELTENLPRIEALIKDTINEQHIKDALNNEHPAFFDTAEKYQMLVLRSIANSQFEMGVPSVTLSTVSAACFCFENVLLTVYEPEDLALLGRMQASVTYFVLL